MQIDHSKVIQAIRIVTLTKESFYPWAYATLWANNITALYTPQQMREIAIEVDKRHTELFLL